MKRLLCVVLFVGLCGVFTASAGAATFTLPGKLTLYENYEGDCVPYYFKFEPMSGQVYHVSGYLQWSNSKEVFSGTAVKEGKQARIALILPTTMDGLKPWAAEFLLNLNTKEATGIWQFTNGDDEGDLLLYPSCVIPVQGAAAGVPNAPGHRQHR